MGRSQEKNLMQLVKYSNNNNNRNRKVSHATRRTSSDNGDSADAAAVARCIQIYKYRILRNVRGSQAQNSNRDAAILPLTKAPSCMEDDAAGRRGGGICRTAAV